MAQLCFLYLNFGTAVVPAPKLLELRLLLFICGSCIKMLHFLWQLCLLRLNHGLLFIRHVPVVKIVRAAPPVVHLRFLYQIAALPVAAAFAVTDRRAVVHL